MKNERTTIITILIVMWMILTGVCTELSHGGEYDHPLASNQDWVDIVGEHIGGWEQTFDITVSVMRDYKAHIKIETLNDTQDDVECNEYFVPNTRDEVVLHRKCGEKEWHKLN